MQKVFKTNKQTKITIQNSSRIRTKYLSLNSGSILFSWVQGVWQSKERPWKKRQWQFLRKIELREDFLIGEFVYLFIYLRLTTFISKEN